jgi:hypothetical protein
VKQRFSSTGVLFALLFASPLLLGNGFAPTPGAFGGVDGIRADGTVVGWAFDPASPSTSIRVRIYRDWLAGEGGTLIADELTDLYRPDINAAYQIEGKHGFEIRLPPNGSRAPLQLFVYGVDATGEVQRVLELGVPVSERWFGFTGRQPWQTLDVTNGGFPGEDGWSAEVISVPQQSALYSLTNRYLIDSAPGWYVRKGNVVGGAWTNVHVYPPNTVPLPGLVNLSLGLTATADGSAIVTAGYYTGSVGTHWFIQRSVDGGATWTTVLDQPPVPTPGAPFSGRKLYFAENDAYGRLYAIGRTERGWAVLRSLDSGTSFQPFDVPYETSEHYSKAFGAAAYNHGIVFTSGVRGTAEGDLWTVRRSYDNGAHWLEVDTFRLAPNAGADFVKTYVSPSTAYVFVHGFLQDGAGRSHSIVRRSLIVGQDWSTVLDYTAYGTDTSVYDMVERKGVLYLSALVGSHGVILRSFDQGVSWSVFDRYVGPRGRGAITRSLVIDPRGDLVTAGTQLGDSGLQESFVRRYPLSNDPW